MPINVGDVLPHNEVLVFFQVHRDLGGDGSGQSQQRYQVLYIEDVLKHRGIPELQKLFEG